MQKHLFPILMILSAAIMIALFAEGAMYLASPMTHVAPEGDHVESSGAITAVRMLVTLIQTTIVAGIIIKIRHYNQQKRRIHKQQFSH